MHLELNIFWLLLPVAALSGWWIGRSAQETKKLSKNIHPEYFKGLNFVLNEQPDKAIEVLNNVITQFPGSRDAKKAQRRIKKLNK